MRFVTEKHHELISSLDQLVKELVGENLDAKKKRASFSSQKAGDLKASISQQDCPSWLIQLAKALEYFNQGHWKQADLIAYLIKNIEIVREYKWAFDIPAESAFDFDSIFEHYKSQSRLPELFEEIIRILEEIQGSGEVDSVAMMAALGKVIATLKKSKNGSYFSINSAWSFLISFLKNYMWGELAKVPVLGTALEALEKTIREANEEMFKLHSEVQAEMQRVVESDVKALKAKADFKFANYDRHGGQIPYLESRAAFNENA